MGSGVRRTRPEKSHTISGIIGRPIQSGLFNDHQNLNARECKIASTLVIELVQSKCESHTIDDVNTGLNTALNSDLADFWSVHTQRLLTLLGRLLSD